MSGYTCSEESLGSCVDIEKLGKQSVRPVVEKPSLSSHPLWIWTSTSSVFTGSEEITERFSLRGRVHASVVTVTVPSVVSVCGHCREAHTGRNSFEARSSGTIAGVICRRTRIQMVYLLLLWMKHRFGRTFGTYSRLVVILIMDGAIIKRDRSRPASRSVLFVSPRQ